MLFQNVTFSGGGFQYIAPQPTFLVNNDWGSFGPDPDQRLYFVDWGTMYNANDNTYRIPSASGVMYVSADGVNWAPQNNGVFASNQFGTVRYIAYGNGKYAALVQDPTNSSIKGIIYSTDGNTWTRATGTIANSAALGMIWSGSRFVSLNVTSPANNSIFIHSTDGVTWANSSMSTRPSTGSITFAANTAGNVVVAGQGAGSGATYQRSTDGGQTFSAVSYPGANADRGSMCFAAGAFVSPRVDNTVVFSSDNGLNWTQTGNIFPSSNGNINGLANSSSIVVAVLNNGGILTTPANNFPNISNDKWTSRTSGTTKNLNNVMYDGSKFIATGEDGIILNSSDGVTWTTVKQPQLSSNFRAPINFYPTGIVQGSTIVMGGSNDLNQIFTSTDGGSTWANSTVSSGIISSIMYDGSKFITGYQGNTLFTSTTGTSWTSTQISGVPTSGLILNLTYGANSTNKYFFTNGANACISPNGSTGWDFGTIESNFVPAGGSSPIGAIYDGTKYVVVGTTGSNIRVGSSAEGTSWTMSTVSGSGTPHGIAFNGSRYVIIGRNPSPISTVAVWTSTDLITWSVASTPEINDNFPAVGYSNTTSRFFAVSVQGSIITSKDGLTWVNSSPNVARPRFEAISGDYIFSDYAIFKFALE